MRETSLRAASGRLAPSLSSGASVPSFTRTARGPSILSSAAHKAIRQRMLLLRHAAEERIVALTGASSSEVRGFLRDLAGSELPDQLIGRVPGGSFAQQPLWEDVLVCGVLAHRPVPAQETGVPINY